MRPPANHGHRPSLSPCLESDDGQIVQMGRDMQGSSRRDKEWGRWRQGGGTGKEMPKEAAIVSGVLESGILHMRRRSKSPSSEVLVGGGRGGEIGRLV